MKIHQAVTSPDDQSSISFREFSCACSSFLSGDYISCNIKDQFKDVIDMITFKKHVFQVWTKMAENHNIFSPRGKPYLNVFVRIAFFIIIFSY